VFVRPFLDLVRVAIGPTIAIVTVPITLVEPLLVLTLELVVELDALDMRAAVCQPLGFAKVRAKDLGVMFQLARFLEARVELLTMVALRVLAKVRRVVAPVRLEHVPTFFRQHDGDVSTTIQALGSDEPFLAEVSEVPRSRIGRPVVVVAEVASRDDPKCADCREGTGFRTPQRVLAVPGIVHDLSFRAARQVEVPREHVARVDVIPLANVAAGPVGMVRIPSIMVATVNLIAPTTGIVSSAWVVGVKHIGLLVWRRVEQEILDSKGSRGGVSCRLNRLKR
jgi:hypothetical protein